MKKPTAQQMQDWIYRKEFFDGYFGKNYKFSFGEFAETDLRIL